MTTTNVKVIEITDEKGAIIELEWLKRCESVHRQFRPQLPENYVATLVRLINDGSRMAVATRGDQLLGLLVYRVVVNTFYGRSLILEDLVTDQNLRSQGLGKTMIDWAAERAVREKCAALRLDTGVQRHAVHRFYMREKMDIVFYHFAKDIANDICDQTKRTTVANPNYQLIEITDESGAITELEWLKRSESVHRQLRPQIPENYIESMKKVFQDHARMTIVTSSDQVLGVMVWRVIPNTYNGQSLYVEDLVTDANLRSQGVGKAMLDWAAEKAATEKCASLGLDSGVQRHEAHRFYMREKMDIVFYHFARDIK